MTRSVTRPHDPPESMRALGGMVPDYLDVFTVTTDGAAATPEEWSRTAIEDVAGRGGQFIWRGVLGLRLEPWPATERVGGWKIAARGADWIRLEASSRLLTAHLVMRLEGAHLSVGTFIRYDRRLAALLWTPAAAVHRRLMPGLLHGTVRRQARRSES